MGLMQLPIPMKAAGKRGYPTQPFVVGRRVVIVNFLPAEDRVMKLPKRHRMIGLKNLAGVAY
jgi:hypothetical protein